MSAQPCALHPLALAVPGLKTGALPHLHYKKRNCELLPASKADDLCHDWRRKGCTGRTNVVSCQDDERTSVTTTGNCCYCHSDLAGNAHPSSMDRHAVPVQVCAGQLRNVSFATSYIMY